MMVAYRVCVNSPSIPINPFMVIMSKVPIVRGFLRLKASKLLHVRLRSVSRSSHASDSTGKQRTNHQVSMDALGQRSKNGIARLACPDRATPSPSPMSPRSRQGVDSHWRRGMLSSGPEASTLAHPARRRQGSVQSVPDEAGQPIP